MMRIDLVSHSVSLLHITATINADIDLMQLFGEETVTRETPRRRTSITGGYRKSGAWHQVVVSVFHRQPGWNLSIFYSCPSAEGHPLSSPPREIRQAMGRIEQVMRAPILGEVEAKGYAHVDCEIDISGMDPILPLPLLRLNDPSAPFTEITGVRLVKESTAGREYSVSLQMLGPENRLAISVGFNFVERVDDNSPLSALRIADQIKRKFLKPKEVAIGRTIP